MGFWFHIHYRKGLLQNNLSLLLSEDTSRIRASLASVASFSSFWSLRRAAVARWDSSSLSSTCSLSCLARRFAFSPYNKGDSQLSNLWENTEPQKLKYWTRILHTWSLNCSVCFRSSSIWIISSFSFLSFWRMALAIVCLSLLQKMTSWNPFVFTAKSILTLVILPALMVHLILHLLYLSL